MKIKREKWSPTRIIFDVAIAVYFGLCWYLYYNQLHHYETGLYESDTVVHVKFAVVDGFYHSLAAFVYKFLYFLPAPDLTISFVLSVATVMGVILSLPLIKKVLYVADYHFDYSVWHSKEYKTPYADSLIYALAFFANFVMGFYLREANRQHYIGYENANMWHNSTYIFMRLFSILTIYFFLDYYDNYKREKGFGVGGWILLASMLALATGFKASFLTVFAPVFGILMLIDVIKEHRLLRAVGFYSVVIPSFIILLVQSRVLASTAEDGGYAIKFFEALRMRGDHPKITIVLSLVFPLMVFASHIKDFYKDRIYTGSLIMWLMAFVELLLFVETGDRAKDGNFMWGYSIALFFLFIMSMIKLLQDWYSSDSIFNKPKFLYLAIETIALVWHVVSGMWYFGLLLSGVTYFV